MRLLLGREKRRPFQHTTVLTVNTLVILLFGRKKAPPAQSDAQPIEPVQDNISSIGSLPIPETVKKTITEGDMIRARDRLRIAGLERDIVGDALTKIYEAQARGLINESEKNQLIQRYKVDLKRVDGEIDVQKRIVDLHELESAKEDLLKSFYEKLMEIDLRIGQLKPGLDLVANNLGEESKPSKPVVKESQPTLNNPPPAQPQQEKPVRERPKSKAEERLEAIKDEVLKAMERLEQIETEP